MARPDEDPLDIEEIQGDILEGLPKRAECLVFFTIEDVAQFRTFLAQVDVTNLATVLAWRKLIADRKANGIETLVPTPGLNIGFTAHGLRRLDVQGLDDQPDLSAFTAGMGGRKEILGDPPAGEWKILKGSEDVHGVFILTGASEAEIADTVSLRLSPSTGQGWSHYCREVGTVRPDPVKGHEHFGYADGVSQPGVRGRIGTTGSFLTANDDPANEDQGQRGQDLLWPGEFVFGYRGQDADAPNLTVPGPVKQPPLPMMKNGAFMVFRRLAQAVPEFNGAVNAIARSIPATAEGESPERLGAQLVGRWKSGAPIIKSPLHDEPALADGTRDVNDFEFGDDRDGMDCPFAAHVRKVYPRDDVFNERTPTQEQVDKAEANTQTHRMMRRGIAFGPEVSLEEACKGASDPERSRGLLFKCYVTSLTNQFEFVQQSWVNNFDFVQPASGFDPLISQVPVAEKPFLGGCPVSRTVSKKPQLLIPSFVHMQGGEYFFSPSLTAIKAL